MITCEKVLADLGFETPTPVQEKCFEKLVLGESVQVLAPTGSGKTLAFLVPLLMQVKVNVHAPQLLILVPTRELGQQVFQVAQKILGVYQKLENPLKSLRVRTLFGGQKTDSQLEELEKNPQVLIGTPGRVLDFLQRDVLNLKGINAFVLDEADLMIGMGFLPQVQTIHSYVPKNVLTALFSATEENKETKAASWQFFEKITAGAHRIESFRQLSERKVSEGEAGNLVGLPDSAEHNHYFCEVTQGEKKHFALKSVLKNELKDVKSGIIFCQTRDMVQTLTEFLQKEGMSVAALSGELGQIERNTILRRFKADGVKFLVATNIVARGIDVEDLGVVINFDLPSVPAEYTHRVGRTGRAGKSAMVLNFCNAQGLSFLRNLLVDAKIELQKFKREQSKQEFEVSSESENLPHAVEAESNARVFSFAKMYLNKGKKEKMRPGDILGALTQGMGLKKEEVGSIFIFDHFTHVEVASGKLPDAIKFVNTNKLKGLLCKASEAK